MCVHNSCTNIYTFKVSLSLTHTHTHTEMAAEGEDSNEGSSG